MEVKKTNTQTDSEISKNGMQKDSLAAKEEKFRLKENTNYKIKQLDLGFIKQVKESKNS